MNGHDTILDFSGGDLLAFRLDEGRTLVFHDDEQGNGVYQIGNSTADTITLAGGADAVLCLVETRDGATYHSLAQDTKVRNAMALSDDALSSVQIGSVNHHAPTVDAAAFVPAATSAFAAARDLRATLDANPFAGLHDLRIGAHILVLA